MLCGSSLVAMAASGRKSELVTLLLEKEGSRGFKNPVRGVSIALFFIALVAILSLVRSGNAKAITTNSSSELLASPIVEAENGIVASDDERCSIAGRDMISKGGHAIDGAIATALCEGVVNPMSSGIGGGGFLLLRLGNGSSYAYDFREVAPAAASKDMYANQTSSKSDGALSVGVPGEIAGLHLAWGHHGKLPWKTLFEPAIKFARDGFLVTPYLEFEINTTRTRIMAHRALRTYLSPNGKLVKAGDMLYNPKLAKTLELIAEQGPGVFYGGIVGEKVIADMKKAGGIMTLEDLKNYRVEVRKPVVSKAMGYTIIGMPPPSSGGASVSLILGILSQYANFSSAPEDLQYHRLVEAFKHTYAVRMNLGDPAFNNFSSSLQDMLSPEFARKLQKKILDNTTFPPEYYESRWDQLEDHGTCHFGVVDTERNAVSLTTTVNFVFGSKLLSRSTGILLNNEMDDFSIPSDKFGSPINFVAPNKRPLSSMAPTIILQNGQLRGVLGASGGIKIITGVAQVFLNYFVKGLDPLAAVTAPRVHHQLIPNEVDCENWKLVDGEIIRVEDQIRTGLGKRGHIVVETQGYCVTQLIVHNPAQENKHCNNTIGRLIGVSDVRKQGSPAGF